MGNKVRDNVMMVSQDGLWGDTQQKVVHSRPETLARRFIIPPFSVFDARQGYWQERKRHWKSIGLRSGMGRGEDYDGTKKGLIFSNSAQPFSVYKKKNEYEAKIGRVVSWDDFYEQYPTAFKQSGTSIFDPVLCEVLYTWFCPPGGSILDPFAGGSVRGVVAGYLGYSYLGVDLSKRQVTENEAQADEILGSEARGLVQWKVGDSLNLEQIVGDHQFDFMFTCPPYYNLEQYGDDEQDLSNANSYEAFLGLYRQIIARSVDVLHNNRFAAIIVSAVRDKKSGTYYDLTGDTIRAFEDAGARWYNDAVLITAGGSIAVRAGRQFKAGRKLAHGHQNVLVFVKGDWGLANAVIDGKEIGDECISINSRSVSASGNAGGRGGSVERETRGSEREQQRRATVQDQGRDQDQEAISGPDWEEYPGPVPNRPASPAVFPDRDPAPQPELFDVSTAFMVPTE